MKNIVVSLACLALIGCATTKATQLGSNVHRIDMRGNAFTDATKANDEAFLKAAEITIDAGHRYFVVESFADTTRTSQMVLPGQTTTSVIGNAYDSGAFTKFSGTATSTSTPSTIHNLEKPGSSSIISTYETKPEGGSFDAYEVVKYYGPRLDGDKWTATEIEKLYLP